MRPEAKGNPERTKHIEYRITRNRIFDFMNWMDSKLGTTTEHNAASLLGRVGMVDPTNSALRPTSFDAVFVVY